MAREALERRWLRAQKWAVLKQHRSLPNAKRHAYHSTMGLVCFLLYGWALTRTQAVYLLIALGGPFFLLDGLRFQSSNVEKLALRYFGHLMRRNELLELSGNSFFILGLLTLALGFPKDIGLLSLLFLSVGDPVAALVGTRYGRTPLWGRKSLEGTAACYFVSAIVSALFAFGYLGLPSHQIWVLALVGGGVSAFCELLPSPVDDNFSIPVLSGLLLSAIQYFWPVFGVV